MTAAAIPSLFGLAASLGLVAFLSPQGVTTGHSAEGVSPAIFPCAPSVDDAGGGGCIAASSIPTLGMLYPMSVSLNVNGTSVGIGTTTPEQKLDVIGAIHTEGDLYFDDDIDGIQFSSVDGNLFGSNTPMIQMFENGTANPDRMVIAHSPGFDDWGLQYRDTSDTMVFKSGSSDVLSVELGSRDVVVHDGRLHVTNDDPAEAALAVTGGQILNTTTNLVDIQGVTGGFFTYDMIECRTAVGDVEFRVSDIGNIYADGALFSPADYAEMIQVSGGATSVEPGDLMVIDPAGDRAIVKSFEARSTLVAGVYSTKPGVVGSEHEGDVIGPDGQRIELDLATMAELYDEIPLAVVGIVPVKASTENGPIRPGDLLVSSSLPGHVMRDPLAPNGTVVGKSLGSLDAGTGRIKMLVTLQ